MGVPRQVSLVDGHGHSESHCGQGHLLEEEKSSGMERAHLILDSAGPEMVLLTGAHSVLLVRTTAPEDKGISERSFWLDSDSLITALYPGRGSEDFDGQLGAPSIQPLACLY